MKIPDASLQFLIDLHFKHNLDFPIEKSLHEKIVDIFTRKSLSTPNPELDRKLEQDAIDIDRIVPGYLKLFMERPSSVAFSKEVDTQPREMLIFNLLISLYEEILENRLLLKKIHSDFVSIK